MGVLVSSDTHAGQLVQIITRVTTEAEASAYQKLIEMDVPKCPHCDHLLRPVRDNMHLVVYNPLMNMFGMEIGKPVTTCQSCGKEVQFPADVDLNAFPTTIAFLQSLRNEYKRRLQAARSTPAVKTVNKKGPK